MQDPVVILGSGFAGSILARALRSRGRSVVLVERGRHPRFALGESSTPLAAISLERLAGEYGLPDLGALAAHGRFRRELESVGRGLKRGFGFYAHRPGLPYANGPDNEARLLVAASPDDEVADSHWLRADVDHHLVRRAEEEGVELLEECEVASVERRGSGWRLEGVRRGRRLHLDAGFVVDATGAAGVLARSLGLEARAPGGLRTGLVYGHFTDVGSFVEAAAPASFPGAPYPEERAALHHLLDEGWMYVLPFDDGRVSAGFVIDRTHPDAAGLLAAPSAASWRRLLGRYPTLGAQFAGARPVRGVATLPRLQRRAARAAGPGWALLPHSFAFASPMFSTGIAWSLVAVERLARALAPGVTDPDARLAGYAALLELEADHLTGLVGPAYAMRGDFDAFVAWSHLYFAAASYAEAWQRLCEPPEPEGWAGDGFLGASDPEMRRVRAEAMARLAEERQDRGGGRGRAARLERAVGRSIAGRNVAGLADPARRRLYPVDLEALVEGAPRLGLAPGEVRSRLPRLRGPAPRPGPAIPERRREAIRAARPGGAGG